MCAKGDQIHKDRYRGVDFRVLPLVKLKGEKWFLKIEPFISCSY